MVEHMTQPDLTLLIKKHVRQVEVTDLGFVPADHLTLLRAPSPDSRLVPGIKRQYNKVCEMRWISVAGLQIHTNQWFVRYLALYRSKAMLRVLRCVETMGDVSLCAVFSCEGCMAARRDGASRGDSTSGSV